MIVSLARYRGSLGISEKALAQSFPSVIYIHYLDYTPLLSRLSAVFVIFFLSLERLILPQA
jgi:hypothetical protein